MNDASVIKWNHIYPSSEQNKYEIFSRLEYYAVSIDW